MPKRILVISNTIDAGGAETFVMKIFRCLDKNKFCFDFLINKKDSNFYLEEIQKLGGKVFYGYSKSRNPLKSFWNVYRTVKNGAYKTVFCIAVHPLGFLDLLAAKLAGAEVRLTRSTNSNSGGKLSALMACVCRPLTRILSTTMLAPSREAGQWLFGKRAVESGQVKIITNGIDMSRYEFDAVKRAQVRSSLGIEKSTFIVGHVGRFNAQKNHKLLLEIFKEIQLKKPDSKLLLVGDGELREAVSQQADALGIADAIQFLGIRKDVPELLAAMDVLVFPSLYEGLPNVVIEAQATGLPCYLSNTITPEVGITELVWFLPLDAEPKIWADAVVQAVDMPRKDVRNEMEARGYSIEKTAFFLASLF